MIKVPARTLIFAETISTGPNEQETVFSAFNTYREAIKNRQEAKNRALVLERQLERSKSLIKNRSKREEQMIYTQQMAQLDREILKLNHINQERSIQKLKEVNNKKSNRTKMHCREAQSQLHSTKTSLYHSTQKKRMENQRIILIQGQKEQASKEISAMKERIREKKRANKIMDYYHHKIEEIRNSKEKEMSRLLKQSRKEDLKLTRMIEKNAKMRLKKEKSMRSSFLTQNYRKDDRDHEGRNPEIDPSEVSPTRQL